MWAIPKIVLETEFFEFTKYIIDIIDYNTYEKIDKNLIVVYHDEISIPALPRKPYYVFDDFIFMNEFITCQVTEENHLKFDDSTYVQDLINNFDEYFK